MKVLLVSSYKISCGIAAYTEGLESLLGKNFDVTVYPLDQSILKSQIPHVGEAGDRLIRELCEQFKNYDVVNLQWEPGILGELYHHMSRRLEWILQAADKLILTVHTVLPYPEPRSLGGFLRFARKRGLARAPLYFYDPERSYRKQTYRILHERAISGKKTYVAVHTEREKQFFRNVVGFQDVVDHPLSLIHAGWPERLQRETPRARRELQDLFPGRRKFIGVFGFLSEYKGIVTALRAMKLLDEDYQLLIYGSVHPNAVKEREPVNAYVQKLMQEIEGGGSSGPVSAPGSGDGAVSNRGPSEALLDKVAFLGSPDDFEFALAMNAVDICIFPYLEVGQSGSGPVSIAVELGKPTIVSRTHAFLELAKYHPKNFEMIDIGNHIQLAQAIARLSKPSAQGAQIGYDRETLSAFYGRLIRDLGNGVRPSAEIVRVDPPEQRRAS